MEDKIKEEFKKWLIDGDDEFVTIDYAFEAGYKARDAEVEEFKQIIVGKQRYIKAFIELKESKNTEIDKLRDALEDAEFLIRCVEIFVKSRHKINKPTGERWFDDKLVELEEALKDGE